jgi:RimJ/RimL family protein N-acetyltransferase
LENVEALQQNFGEKITNAEKLWRMGYSNEAINKRLEMGFETDDLPDEEELPESEADPQVDDEQVKRLLKAVSYGG